MSCFVVSPFVAASRYCVVCEAQRHTVLSVCSIGFEFLIASFCFLPVARVFSWRGFVFDTKLQMKLIFFCLLLLQRTVVVFPVIKKIENPLVVVVVKRRRKLGTKLVSLCYCIVEVRGR